jgi:Domain of unknown function (DUF4159)
MKATAFTLLLICLMLLSSSAQSQRGPRRPDFMSRRGSGDSHRKLEFTFARLEYDSFGWRGTWMTDYPEADEHFIMGLRNWCRSNLAISDDPISCAPGDKDLFKHPFVYIVEPGRMDLSNEDAANLREYLTRGGFLMLDDFWGEYEWRNVQEQMRKVFPEYPIKELPLDHPIFHCYFDIDEVVQVPLFHNYLYNGITYEKGGYVPHYEGIIDDTGRVMVFIARNCDNGDAWEWIDDPAYPLKYGLAAYRLGMNLIVYAMTH